jgi:hypothetical protein
MAAGQNVQTTQVSCISSAYYCAAILQFTKVCISSKYSYIGVLRFTRICIKQFPLMIY